MRFYIKQLHSYCGIDMHAHTMHVCILNRRRNCGARNMPTSPEALPRPLHPIGRMRRGRARPA
jgi:hypothetical protein